MKRLLQFFLAVAIITSVTGCSKDENADDDIIWDIAPSGVVIQLVDEAGNNMLDPDVRGNWVGQPMWIGCGDNIFNVVWKNEDPQKASRAYMPHFYGAIWSGNHLYFGEFDGAKSQDLKFTFGITAINTVYDIEYSHRLIWENKKPHFDDHITLEGNRINGNVLTIVVPENE